MMKKLFLLFLFVSVDLFAEIVIPSELAKKAHLASINTLLIFTSQEGLNSGHYNFNNAGVKMEVYHLPFIYHLESHTDVNYFIVGNVGYSRVYLLDNIEIPGGVRLNYDNHIQTYTAGIGGGARYKLTPELAILGGFEIIYSASGVSVKEPKNDFGQVIKDLFNKNYTQNISYELLAGLEYKKQIHEFKPYVSLTYKMYDTKSTFDFKELAKIETQSSIITATLGIESPKLLEYGRNYVTTEAYGNANLLYGTVRDVVKFKEFYTIGGVLYYYTPKKPWWASRFFLELSAARSDGLEGYNVGIGFTVDF